MKKQEHKNIYEISDFENHCHLWNIILNDKAIVMLRKIVDAIQSDNYSAPGNTLPSFLITGASGKKLVAKALVNSLIIEDVRECHAKYFENDIPSFQFFWDSYTTTAHVITEIEQLRGKAESALWKYLKNRECSYYNDMNRTYDKTVHCNGLIIMTAKKKNLIPNTILRATDHIIELQELNQNQLEAAIHQRLVFCGISYAGEEVLKAIVKAGNTQIDSIIKFLKICILMMKAEMLDYLDMEVVNRAKWLNSSSVPPPPISGQSDDIPF